MEQGGRDDPDTGRTVTRGRGGESREFETRLTKTLAVKTDFFHLRNAFLGSPENTLL